MATTTNAPKVAITFVFGRKSYEYGDGGEADPFLFTISVEGMPGTWHSAYALLGFFRDEFIAACKAAKTSTSLSPVEEFEIIIPTCYLNFPTIELGKTELLLDGEQPNPWLSRKQ